MSKNFFENLSSEERAELATLVKPLRQTSGLTKKDVYDEAAISRQTLDNIENGATVPQADVLKRVLDVVGYEVDEPEFAPQTQTWLVMIGTLIETVPESRRPQAVDMTIRRLALEARHTEADDEPTMIEVAAQDVYGLAAEGRRRRADIAAVDEEADEK